MKIFYQKIPHEICYTRRKYDKKVTQMEKLRIINSKLIPPIPSATYMRRSSFVKKMNEATGYRLTISHSGPGFGKSMGVAQFFKDVNLSYSWYTITEEDDDIIPFVSYLKDSIRRVVPDFGNTLPNLATSSTFIKEDELRQWMALFINELCAIEHSLTIIIDDYHLVDHVFQINFIMEKIIELLPPHVRIIIVTRTLPKWSNLLRLKLKDHFYEMTKDDLVFSQDEITVYLEDYFNIEIEEEKAAEMVAITEGWAIAINLMALHLSESELTFSHMLKPVFQNLFDYLSEEVFQRRTKEEQAWLLAFAIFPTFSAELMEEFYEERAVTVMQQLALEHGFIQSLAEENTYRFHALYLRFLRNKWLQTEPDKYVELQKRATKYYYEKDDYLQATYHASQTKDSRFIARTLTDTAFSLIRSGQFDWFLDLFNELDERTKQAYYSLFYFEGEVQRYRAYYDQARKAYEKCLVHAEQWEDAYYLSRSNAGIAHIFLDTIQPALAESYLKKAIDFSQQTDRMEELEKAMLKRQFAENLVNLGRAKDALEWVKKEQLQADILREGNLDARIFLRMGRLVDAKSILQERATKRTTLPDSHRETEVLLSLIYGMIGQADTAIRTAEQGIQIGKKEKSYFIEAVGFTRAAHAKVLANPYLLEEASDDYQHAIDIFEQLKVPRVKAEPYMGFAMLKARQENFDDAIKYGMSALRETEKVNDEWMSGLIHVSLAIIYFYQKNLELSEFHSVEAKKLFHVGGDLYGEMIASFWLMNVYYKKRVEEQFLQAAIRFSDLCVENNYLFFVTKETIFSPFDRQNLFPIVSEVRKQVTSHPNIEVIASEIELDKHLYHPGYEIYGKVFGRFQLMLGKELVDERVWQREKAKELFLYLLLNKGRFIRKEEIMEALWEHIDEKTANRNFKVTMNALLKVLEPKRKARQPSYFIHRKNTMYTFNPLAKIVSDMELFKTLAKKGLAETDINNSNSDLLKANLLYQGTPFEELRDVDWISQQREELENIYIHVLERLGQNYLKKNEYHQTINWAEKIVKMEKTWEEAYRLLMLAYYRLENRPQSLKWYEKCVQSLKEELNIQPMDSTNEIVQMIRQHEQ